MNIAVRKIIKIGHSYGVTIPDNLLKQAGLKHGNEVVLEYTDDGIKITKNKKASLPEGISKDFYEHAQETIQKYDNTIKGLANR